MQVKVQEVRKYLTCGEHGGPLWEKKKAAREICGDMKKRKADIKYHITKGLNARVRRQIQLKRQGKALHYFE